MSERRNLSLTDLDVRVLCLALRNCDGEEQHAVLIPHARRLRELRRRVEGLCETSRGKPHNHSDGDSNG